LELENESLLFCIYLEEITYEELLIENSLRFFKSFYTFYLILYCSITFS